ncbi:MAG: branched-chain amino acid ABC transporter ATP-binding protein/permease [Chloroflexi bacterium]|nr:MAG: branched-chain amino acid ABC transporter ATP-binding protein/permease [Chloroflexota bacterium]
MIEHQLDPRLAPILASDPEEEVSPLVRALTDPAAATVGRLVLLAALIAWPFVLPLPLAIVNDASRAAEYAIVGVSLVLLTGWVGQISLAQGAFVGVGAFATALAQHKLHIPFPLSLPVAVATSAAVAILLGLVALRVRGLYLAVATLIFAYAADKWLFASPWFVGEGGSTSLRVDNVGRQGTFPSFDLHDGRIFYIVAVAGLGLALYAAANLRDSKTGRAFFAIRGSEVAAASLGIDITRYKLLAFGLSGALAGLAGHLLIVDQRSAVPDTFNFLTSLFYLSIVVVGGLTSLPGAVGAAMLFSGLHEVFFRVSALNGYIDIVSGLLLLGVLLAYPGGLAAAGRRVRVWGGTHVGVRLKALFNLGAADGADGLRERLRLAPEPEPSPDDAPDTTDEASVNVGLRGQRAGIAREAVLAASHITVRFGGLLAVDDVSMTVPQGDIVGLIGPNGAGKTTLFNAIAGLNDPTAGKIHLFGRDATKLAVHERARLGVGRTFQLVQLFAQLNVFDNLLTATHVRNRSGFLQHIAVSERAVLHERRSRERVAAVIDFLELGEVAYRTVAGLPFGILRSVELARALVTGAPFIMLDEPASGLDNAETEQLARLLRRLRFQLGITILLIEHDVPMVTGVSDYMYVLNRGRLLAEGSPADIQRNDEVIAAYLGEPVLAAVGT